MEEGVHTTSVEPNPTAAPKQRWRTSLRLRVSLWNAGVISVTLAVLTGAAIHEERRQLVRAEAANASALLDHLVHMPQFQEDVATVRAHLELMRGSLRAAGGALDLVPRASRPAEAANAEASGVIATRALALREGAFELRYSSSGDRLEQTMWRSVAMHLLYGVVALAALLAGTEWILRANLLAPLRSLSRQIERMRDGHGWLSRVPPTDEELSSVAGAVADLGPALERQVHEWIEAERRSAVAQAIRNIRVRLAGSTDVLDAALTGTQTSGSLASGSGLFQLAVLVQDAIHAERERIGRALADEEHAAFGETAKRPPETESARL